MTYNQGRIEETYRHLYLIIEHEEGRIIPVSLEMLGEARRIMDEFNIKYSSDEKVVAVVPRVQSQRVM